MAKKSSIWFDGDEYRWDADCDDYVCRKSQDDGKPVVVKYKEARRKKYIEQSHCDYCDPLVVHGPGAGGEDQNVAVDGAAIVQESKTPKIFDRANLAKNVASLLLQHSKKDKSEDDDSNVRYAAKGYEGYKGASPGAQGAKGASGASGSRGVKGIGSRKNSMWFNGYEYVWDDRIGDFVHWVNNGGKSTPITYRDARKKAIKEAKKEVRARKKAAKANIKEKERDLKKTKTKSWSETKTTKFKATEFDLYTCASYGNSLRQSWAEWSVVVAQMKENGFSKKRIDKFVDMAVEKSVDTFRRAYKHNGGVEALVATMQGFSPLHAKALQSQYLDKLSPDESANDENLERLVRDVFVFGARSLAIQANPNACRSVARQLQSSYVKGLNRRGYFNLSGARDKQTVVSAFKNWRTRSKQEKQEDVRKEATSQGRDEVRDGGRPAESNVGRDDEIRRVDAGAGSGTEKADGGSVGGGTGGGETSVGRHNDAGDRLRDQEEPRIQGVEEPQSSKETETQPEPEPSEEKSDDDPAAKERTERRDTLKRLLTGQRGRIRTLQEIVKTVDTDNIDNLSQDDIDRLIPIFEKFKSEEEKEAKERYESDIKSSKNRFSDAGGAMAVHIGLYADMCAGVVRSLKDIKAGKESDNYSPKDAFKDEFGRYVATLVNVYEKDKKEYDSLKDDDQEKQNDEPQKNETPQEVPQETPQEPAVPEQQSQTQEDQPQPSSSQQTSSRKLANFVAGASKRRRNGSDAQRREAGLDAVLRNYRELKNRQANQQTSSQEDQSPESEPEKPSEETLKRRRAVIEARRKKSPLWNGTPQENDSDDESRNSGVQDYPKQKTGPRSATIGDVQNAAVAGASNRLARYKEARAQAFRSAVLSNYRELKNRRDNPPAEPPKIIEAPISIAQAPKEPGLTPGVPEKVDYNQVYEVPIDHLKVDPKRFQFKLGGDQETGASDLYSGAKFDLKLSNTIMVWRDPDDGNDYVVNGHHRMNIARKSGYTGNMRVIFCDSKTAEDAKVEGAIFNIADGKGSEIDVADVMRNCPDWENRPKVRQHISKNNKLAENGRALANLSEAIYNRVKRGEIDWKLAVPIGKILPMGSMDSADEAQNQAYKIALGNGRKKPSADDVRRIAQSIAGTKAIKNEGGPGGLGLFADAVDENDWALKIQESAKLLKDVESFFSDEKKVNNFAAKSKNTKKLNKSGVLKGETDADLAKKYADAARTILSTFRDPESSGYTSYQNLFRNAKYKYEDYIDENPKDEVGRKKKREELVAEIIGKFFDVYNDGLPKEKRVVNPMAAQPTQTEEKPQPETPKVEEPPKTEPAKTETPKSRPKPAKTTEPPKAEQPPKATEQPPKAEEPQPEPPKTAEAPETKKPVKRERKKPAASKKTTAAPKVEKTKEKASSPAKTPKESKPDPSIGKDLDTAEKSILRFINKIVGAGKTGNYEDFLNSVAEELSSVHNQTVSPKYCDNIVYGLEKQGYIEQNGDNNLTLSQKGKDALRNIGAAKTK